MTIETLVTKDRCFLCTPRCDTCDEPLPGGRGAYPSANIEFASLPLNLSDPSVCDSCQSRLTLTQVREIVSAHDPDYMPVCEDCCEYDPNETPEEAEKAIREQEERRARIDDAQDKAWKLAPPMHCPNGHSIECRDCVDDITDRLLAEEAH